MSSPSRSVDSVMEEAIASLQRGELVIVQDDESRENEGDLVAAASLMTPEKMKQMIDAGGLVCLALHESIVERLCLPPMVTENECSKQTAFTISIDAKDASVSTGISASDRTVTVRKALNEYSTRQDFTCPGHVFPLKARRGGLRERRGHTEAAVDLMQLCSLPLGSVICEILNPDGAMARTADLKRYAAQHKLVYITIQDIVDYQAKNQQQHQRQEHHHQEQRRDLQLQQAAQPEADSEQLNNPNTGADKCTNTSSSTVNRVAALLPCQFVSSEQDRQHLKIETYTDLKHHCEHVVITNDNNKNHAGNNNKNDSDNTGNNNNNNSHETITDANDTISDDTSEVLPPLVRIHSQCITGDTFGSLRCDCGAQLQASLRLIGEHGGALIYLTNHEGRGIGLRNKIQCYELQDRKQLDTVDANLQLGFSVDHRSYSAAVEIVHNVLQWNHIRLLTNNPDKIRACVEANIQVTPVPLNGFEHPMNKDYLQTKRSRLKHTC